MRARKDTRFPVRCPVAYALEDAAYQGRTFSLSRGGCAIESDEMASEGETVSLQIMEPGFSAAIRVELGRICWATRREFGVEFLVILNDSKEWLNHFLLQGGEAECGYEDAASLALLSLNTYAIVRP